MKALSGGTTLLSLHLNMEAIPRPDALVVMDECNLKSVEMLDLEEGLMSGDALRASMWYSTSVLLS